MLSFGTDDLGMLVAPHAGAWIEMFLSMSFKQQVHIVAPHAGAWIEM